MSGLNSADPAHNFAVHWDGDMGWDWTWICTTCGNRGHYYESKAAAQRAAEQHTEESP